MMNKFMIVDGSNLLFQMFYGMPSHIVSADGKPIHATVGFIGALLKIIRMVNPTHAVVLFDGECKNERKELDPEYKANRPDYSLLPDEDNPFSQLEDIYTALDHLGIKHSETTCCETDDWISSYVYETAKNADIVIVSQDSDFFQLISEHVSILRYRGEHTVFCDPAYIREKLGIEPHQYAAYKSLTGDHADNIQGLRHIGPKTAAALMRQFNTLDNLLSHADSISKPSIRQSVSEGKDRLIRNYSLISLSGQAPLPFSISELTYQHCNTTTTQVLKAIHLR